MKPSRTISEQFDLDFDAEPLLLDGLLSWREVRRRDLKELCRRLGVPLEKEVEVRLGQGPLLRGVLQLADEMLWIEAQRETVILQIGATTFRLSEIESVLRI